MGRWKVDFQAGICFSISDRKKKMKKTVRNSLDDRNPSIYTFFFMAEKWSVDNDDDSERMQW